MNKKAIWLIIGLMSAALVGIVVTQSYWINYAVDLNEDQFDKNVRLALNNVAKALENEELHNYAVDKFFPAFPSNPIASEEAIFNFLSSDPDFENPFSFYKRVPEDSFPALAIDISSFSIQIANTDKIWEEFKVIMAARRAQSLPLAQRINPKKLQRLLENELKGKGIGLNYNFGVYDNRSRKFIISKESDEDVIEYKNVEQAGMVDLFSSLYSVNLFPKYAPGSSVISSTGRLFVDFPGKQSFLMSSVWLVMLGAIGFTGIILFCFIYTIQVIFQQKKTSEIKNDFLNNMTHEFKTPIATISLAADSITSPIISGSPEKVKRFANIIKEENKRMNKQVERVLQMAMIDKKDFQIKMEEININDIIESAVGPIGLQIEKKEGTISQQLNCKNPVIIADKTHFTNVVHNLLDNANKYSPDKPTITILSRDVKNGVEVLVKDKGIGMSKEDKKHIFDKFFRVHTGNLHDVKGFGLGLSYVKAIMDAHSGTIDVKSELGKGSEFILFFPKT